MINTKICTKCGETKGLNEFSKRTSAPDGLMWQCRSCMKIQHAAYRTANPKKVRLQSMVYRKSHHTQRAAYGLSYYASNRDVIKEKRTASYKAHPEKSRAATVAWTAANDEKCRATSARWYASHREEKAATTSIWRKANPGRLTAYAAHRRAMKLHATPDWLTLDDYQVINEFYTGRNDISVATGISYEVDHIVPLQGKTVCGLHVPWNLRIVTQTANRQKGNKLKLKLSEVMRPC